MSPLRGQQPTISASGESGSSAQAPVDRAGEAAAFFSQAAKISRQMCIDAEQGRFTDLSSQMKERAALLTRARSLAEDLKPRSSADEVALRAWSRVAPALGEFSRENGQLIRALKEQGSRVARKIAEAESRRRISRYMA
ncbi:MAG TPA: hypothetical protein VL126_14735 [Bacteroidota bacterium]|nr:hypothetical protein [Bacteroidota bacterium]